jgi:hypothetical protein
MASTEAVPGKFAARSLVILTLLPVAWLVAELPFVGSGIAVYTVISLATECIFTGFGDQARRLLERKGIDWDLPCRTYLWAPVVYGIPAAVSFPLMDFVAPGNAFAGVWPFPPSMPPFYDWPWWVRGAIYSAGIFAWEFYWAWVIETLTGKVPWQYKVSTYRIWRYIRPRYALFWGLFGFVLEWTHLHIIHRLDDILPFVLK